MTHNPRFPQSRLLLLLILIPFFLGYCQDYACFLYSWLHLYISLEVTVFIYNHLLDALLNILWTAFIGLDTTTAGNMVKDRRLIHQ